MSDPNPDPAAPGRFVHRDLMSTDPAAAQAFFGELFGWTAHEVQPGGPESKHTQLRAGDRTVCALMALDPSHGIPSHFVPYVATDDVDALCERARAAGGSVCYGPLDLGDAGRWALVNDAGGGLFTAWRGSAPYPPEPEGHPPAGEFCWEELLAVDLERESAFYAQVCGWDTHDVGVEGQPYRLFRAGERERAGGMQKPAEAPGPSMWLSYVYVDDVEATVARARELGAQVWVEPRTLPDIGVFAVLADPTGAAFAVHRGVDRDPV